MLHTRNFVKIDFLLEFGVKLNKENTKFSPIQTVIYFPKPSGFDQLARDDKIVQNQEEKNRIFIIPIFMIQHEIGPWWVCQNHGG